MALEPSAVSFLNPLPGDTSAQRALAEVLRDALEGLPGPWRVGATPGARPGSAVVTAIRDDGFQCTVFLETPMQRTFLYVRDQVANALQLHVLGIPRPGMPTAKLQG
jgi:hypothetical protein